MHAQIMSLPKMLIKWIKWTKFSFMLKANHTIVGFTLNAGIYEDVTSSSRSNRENHTLKNDNNLVEKTSREQQHTRPTSTVRFYEFFL